MTVGPWKPIYLHTYKTRMSDFDIRPQVSPCLDANLVIDITLSDKCPALVSLTLKDHDGSKPLDTGLIPMYNGQFQKEFHFPVGVIELWFPVRYGNQPIYVMEVHIFDPVFIAIARIIALLISLARMKDCSIQ
jgi:beta-mannosidase